MCRGVGERDLFKKLRIVGVVCVTCSRLVGVVRGGCVCKGVGVDLFQVSWCCAWRIV